MFGKIKAALSQTRERVSSLFGKKFDPETKEELEALLFSADIGATCTEELIHSLKGEVSPETLKAKALELLKLPKKEKALGTPHVVLTVGVNGSGKTTSLGKLAKRYAGEGKSVLIVAGDTFRVAAVEQLKHWADSLAIEIISTPWADPSSIVFDAITRAKAEGIDVVLIDTAGRLQSKTDLMQELGKMARVCKKVCDSAPHETLLVIDATTGQNGLDQARIFNDFVPLTGLIVTKLDGTAKGGIALPIHRELQLPIEYIGVGESADDLLPFTPEEYVEALFTS